ncbi:SCO family protein [Sinisalibacter lacisalsi]|uniref:Protein senC n=1 Tax=Sinisalibacter lacisalsi TaxID=1526570 RepID=A0ABQ1QB78_9RHOB|nr:SCO family protein [Sinisalibacter lacisalsi]GGD21222.1 protein senC [Sinisalibacter lacisalsi]
MRKIIALAATVAVAALVGVSWWMSRPADDDRFADCRETSIGTGIASIGGPLSLIDENGDPVTDAEMFTKPTLVYFGYSFCPDVCPLDNARNAEALDILIERGYDAQMAFISVDPERDDPERLRDFTDYLHPEAYGYTGTMEQVRAASQAYKTYFKKEEDPDPEFYLIDHSTFTYLVLPEAGFVEFFKRDEGHEEMADRVGCFIDAAR